jgi:hypothetical protein
MLYWAVEGRGLDGSLSEPGVAVARVTVDHLDVGLLRLKRRGRRLW